MEWSLKEAKDTRKTSKEWRLVKTKDGVAVEYKGMHKDKFTIPEKPKAEKVVSEHTCGKGAERAERKKHDEKQDSCLAVLREIMKDGEVDEDFKRKIEEAMKSSKQKKGKEVARAVHTCEKK